jgi:DNA-binding MarR family transcriptional regulator
MPLDPETREKLKDLSNKADKPNRAPKNDISSIWHHFVNDPMKTQMVSMFKPIAYRFNLDRFRIYFLITQKEYNVSEIQEIIQRPQSTVSRHLKVLEEANFIQGIKDGKQTYYRPVTKSIRLIQDFMFSWINSISNWYGGELNIPNIPDEIMES